LRNFRDKKMGEEGDLPRGEKTEKEFTRLAVLGESSKGPKKNMGKESQRVLRKKGIRLYKNQFENTVHAVRGGQLARGSLIGGGGGGYKPRRRKCRKPSKKPIQM